MNGIFLIYVYVINILEVYRLKIESLWALLLYALLNKISVT